MKILAYDDNPDYGGHQTMACQGIEALAADPALEVVFMFNPHNGRLAERIAGIPSIRTMEAPCTTRKLQGLHNRFAGHGIHALEKLFRALDPDLVLCIQGEIEDSSQAVLAAHKAGIECVSYLAIPHPMQLMGAKFGRLRDRVNQCLLNQPDRYIAISESMERIMIERGIEKPIVIVPNGIPTPPGLKPKTQHRLTLGLLGRIEFNQKRQDFMVRTFCAFPEQFKNCQLLIAGGGPYEGKLKRLIAECPRRDEITLLPWQDNTEAFYTSIDFLMLPSRFEGVPLVMLEALVRGIPVVGSRRDGMRDLLPENWTFEPENAGGMANTFSKIRPSWRSEIDAPRKKVETEMSLDAFRANFHRAITKA